MAKVKKKVAKKVSPQPEVSANAENLQNVAESATLESPAQQAEAVIPGSGAETTPASAKPPEAKPEITPEQQAEIDRVLKANEQETKRAIEAILGGKVEAGVGTPTGDQPDKTQRVQRDHMPGKFRRDPSYVPEHVYDEVTGERKKVLDHNNYRYYMVTNDELKLASATAVGWKYCLFDGGSRSGLLNGGFKGTGDAVFTRDIYGHCRRGDVFLMWMEVRRYEELREIDRDEVAKASLAPVGEFANVAYGKGIRAMAQVNGEDIL